ncbi:MAG: nickel pincer cofactor biosynthesis protein LarC [Gaiellales bacterium]|nr:MAG: nickel pincer cofactor biosynthesis protein LarC [Gaiellales bacterium]
MTMERKTLFIDCFSGVSGDMFVAALLDLGVGSIDMLREELGRLDLEGWEVELERVRPSGIAASRFIVRVAGEKQEPRSLSDINDLISSSRLSENVKSRCLAIFSRVGRAEAEAHGHSLQEVHFHEVGMVDSIIDIVSACLLMEELAPAEVICSPVEMGSGMVDTKHGLMPVPAPATEILLRGVPVAHGGEECELTTPTGAALVGFFTDSFEPLPAMRIEAIGYGSGTRETQRPNVIRFLLGERASGDGGAEEVEHMVQLETNIDDSTPELLASMVEEMMAQGANDAWLTPVIMKKGRPGVQVSVLCPRGALDRFMDLFFSQSSTFGVRVREVERHCLERRLDTVGTDYGFIRVKKGLRRGRVVTAAPEYEDCRRAAREHGVPLKVVYEAALVAAVRPHH